MNKKFYEIRITNFTMKRTQQIAAMRLAQYLHQDFSSSLLEISKNSDYPFDWITNQMLSWPNYIIDMKNLSKEFPDIVFLVEIYGGEPDDIWKDYFKNGKQERCYRHYYWDDPPIWSKG